MRLLKLTINFIAVILLAGIMLAAVPKTVEASHEPFVYQYRSPIISVDENLAVVRVFTQNISNERFTTPICAIDLSTRVLLGCISDVTYNGAERYDFSVWRFLTPGKHNIAFTYRTPEGNWHEITNHNHRILRARFFTF